LVKAIKIKNINKPPSYNKKNAYVTYSICRNNNKSPNERTIPVKLINAVIKLKENNKFIIK